MVGKDLIMATLLGSGGGSSGSGGGGAGGGDEKSLIDAMIERTPCELTNNTATKVGKYAFYKNASISKVDLPKVINVEQYAFSDCTGLGNISLPEVVEIGVSAFSCSSSIASPITEVCFPKLTTASSSCFEKQKQIKKAKFPMLEAVPSNMFYTNQGVMALERLDLGKATSIAGNAFNKCAYFSALILRSETLCSLSTTYNFSDCYHMLGTTNSSHNPAGLHDGYVYVPRSLVEEYPAATNWSALTLQYRALEDYTVDGTITGELDESKI